MYMEKVAILIFDNFETLDVFGPVEIFGILKEFYAVTFYSLPGGLVSNTHGVTITTEKLECIKDGVPIFLIPGGYGTREAVNNNLLLHTLSDIAQQSTYVLTVCTGSGLLAKTGLLNGKKATSNKRAFEWAMLQGEEVHWIKKARWVVDGKFYTSAGVSAGMDMVFGFLHDRHGIDFARKIAYQIEYTWQEDKEADDFFDQ